METTRLTRAECKAAIDQANKYPPEHGNVYLAKSLTDEAFLELYPSGMPDSPNYRPWRFGNPHTAAAWLKLHPEDLEHGWPAVAVAAVRGDLTGDGLYEGLCAVTSACHMLDNTDYCTALNKPICIVNLLTQYLAELPEEDEWWQDSRFVNAKRQGIVPRYILLVADTDSCGSRFHQQWLTNSVSLMMSMLRGRMQLRFG